MNLNEFFYMGGYAFYVWTSYSVAFLVLIWNIAQPLLQHKALLRQLTRRARRGEGQP